MFFPFTLHACSIITFSSIKRHFWLMETVIFSLEQKKTKKKITVILCPNWFDWETEIDTCGHNGQFVANVCCMRRESTPFVAGHNAYLCRWCVLCMRTCVHVCVCVAGSFLSPKKTYSIPADIRIRSQLPTLATLHTIGGRFNFHIKYQNHIYTHQIIRVSV